MATLTHSDLQLVAREIQSVPNYLLGSDLHAEWTNNVNGHTDRELYILSSKAKGGDSPPYYLIQGRDEGEASVAIYNEDGYYLNEYEFMPGLSISNAYTFLYK